MQKAVCYISSILKNDIEREVELKVQKERAMAFCKNNEYEFYAIYEEPKESTEDYKSELFRLLDNSAKGEFDAVIVLNLDRIAFDNVAKVWVAHELKKNGVKLISLSEDMTLGVDADEKTKDKAEKIKERVKDIPSLPEIVNEVISLVQNPNSSALQLSKIIANDAGLTARVLRLVNSAYYGFPKQISSIQHAIAILGFTTLRGLVLSSSIFKIFAPRENIHKMLDYKKLWKHSLMCAVISKHLNKKLRFQDDENIFSSAILHDMGKIILDQYDHANYIMALADFDDLNFAKNLAAEKKYCFLNHCEVGYLISEHWNLPAAISETIRCHHFPADAETEHRKIVNIIAVANILAISYEQNKELNPTYFNNVDLDCLNLDLNELFDFYFFMKELLLQETSFDEFFD